ncbi:CMP-N-acetylneuraminate-beta-galactosamide-alpha-2,3-sialyltransferase 4 isoform X2 [Anabas testudineus]|uniref:CMP-N-acetylneuraminate-beta-galactosamide- alpha-2,3-sialyltransferase 4 isoform X2 n=1 Tax=Anabas testudineus TaxID=64144 RepID=UPI000E45DDC9|nr:CMP-N-acetylneuraminate-beta-galactosamide-alpha-2,3-sialyltransferase 4 isoform X2 [Anabas testudineus]
MFQKTPKTWCLRLLPVLLFFIALVIYHCPYVILRRYIDTSKFLNSSKSLCGGRLIQWESLNFNINRTKQLFLKLEDFFWREHVSKLALPYGIKGSEPLLLKVLAVTANYQVPADIDNLECRTCVVIGNGFSIKNSSLGRMINTYDVVIRLNDAPVRGYENDVGSKTTMRFFYPESASSDPRLHNEPDTLMVLVPFKQQDLQWLKEILYNEKRGRKGFWKPPPQIWVADVNKIRVLDPHFLWQTANRLLQIPLRHRSKQSVHPTTGILAVFVALNYCDVVHIAGFGYPNSRTIGQPIHYYGNDTMKSMKNSYHDLKHEAETLKRLKDSGAVMYLNSDS